MRHASLTAAPVSAREPSYILNYFKGKIKYKELRINDQKVNFYT